MIKEEFTSLGPHPPTCRSSPDVSLSFPLSFLSLFFVLAGDKLREHQLAVPPMHDRYKPIPRPNMQAGFISALVLPLWTHLVDPVFAQIMDVKDITNGMRANLGRYTDIIKAAKEKAEREAKEKAEKEAAAANNNAANAAAAANNNNKQ